MFISSLDTLRNIERSNRFSIPVQRAASSAIRVRVRVPSTTKPSTSNFHWKTKTISNLQMSPWNDLPSINISSDDVLGNQDIIDGTIIAFLLAFLFSFLQGRSPSSSNVKLWPAEKSNDSGSASTSKKFSSDPMASANINSGDDQTGSNSKADAKVIFDGDAWREVSKPENYVLYTSKIRNKGQQQRQLKQEKDASNTNAFSQENRIVLLGLLVLFVPIFSVEFFFALSRQFVCGDFVTQVDDTMWLTDADRALSASNEISPWAKELCSPHLDLDR